MIEKLLGYLTGDGYRSRAIRSTGMTLLNISGNKVIRLASSLILTRLLFPEAFGLMALVGVVTTAAVMFSDLGFLGAVIQDPRGEEPDFLDTVWTLQILRGALLSVIILACAGPVAAFYEEPILAEMLWVSAFVPLIQGTHSTKVLTANRTLQIERLTLLRLAVQTCSATITIALAYTLETVWALVIGGLFGPTLMSIASHTLLKGHANWFKIEREALWSLLKYGGFIFIASVAGFIGGHTDRAILGKFIELDELAIYGIAMTIATLPMGVSFAIAGRVVLPLYARRPPAESVSNRRNLNKARYLVTAPLVLASLCFAAIGDPLLRFLYDERYEAAGPYLALIALVSIPLIITQTYPRVPLAAGHSGRYAVFQCLSAAVRFGLLLLLVPLFGVLGAILMVPISAAVLYVPMILNIYRYKAWDPLHDVIFTTLGIAGAIVVYMLNAPVLAPTLEPLFTYIQ